jgi:hypothetical protein
MSGERILSASGSASSVAVGFSRRTIALLLAVLIGLATFVFLLIGGGVSTAYAQETKPISAKALTEHGCDPDEWGFVITGIDDPADAPASITVVWANGDTEVVPLDEVTGKTAHYRTTSNLDSTVVSATAEIFA